MILITSAPGNNANAVIRELTKAGVRVRALLRNPNSAGEIKGPLVEVAVGDFLNTASLDAALRGVEKVFLIPPTDPRSVEMQVNFIRAAKRAGTRHVVKLSVNGADVNSPVRVARWHAEGEKELEASGIPFTHLRPNAFMQNLLGLAPTIVSQGEFYQPAADGKVSHIDVRDIAAVAAKALTENGHQGKTYVITGPEALSYDEAASKISKAIGKPVKYVNVTPEDFKKSLLGWGIPEFMADGLNEFFAAIRAGYCAVVTNTVEEVTKRKPISFDDFVRDFAGAFTARPQAAG
ncbi:MAG: SDR family oxidoreductase [Terriglobales bacterium]|jgi:uncharacterized protein YbjT (DUF2867 family)